VRGRDPERRVVRTRHLYRVGKRVRQRRVAALHGGDPGAARARQPRPEHAVQKSARGELESIPAPGRAQAGPLGDQRREQRVSREMAVDGRDVRAEVEDTTDARDDPRQCTHARESNRRCQAPRVWEVNDLDRSRLTVLAYGARVGLRVDLLDPVDRARAQVGQDGRPVVRWSIPQPDRDAGRADRALRQCGDDFPAERARRAVEEVLERLVEAPHASEPRRQGDLGHR